MRFDSDNSDPVVKFRTWSETFRNHLKNDEEMRQQQRQLLRAAHQASQRQMFSHLRAIRHNSIPAARNADTTSAEFDPCSKTGCLSTKLSIIKHFQGSATLVISSLDTQRVGHLLARETRPFHRRTANPPQPIFA